MSDASHDDAHGDDTHAHAHEVYEGKPADTIPPDEPHTPGWMPLVGVALVLAVILGIALKDPSPESEEGAPAASVAAQAPTPPPAEAAPPPTGPRPPARAVPLGSAPLRMPGLPSALRPRPAPGAPGAGERPQLPRRPAEAAGE